MKWIYLSQAIAEYMLWACCPSNDNWPVSDEIAKDMPLKVA